jgi:hypothetical protein
MFHDAHRVDPNDANIAIGGQTSTTCGRRNKGQTTWYYTDGSGLHADDHVLVFDGAETSFTETPVVCGGDNPHPQPRSTLSDQSEIKIAANTLQFESIAVHPTDRSNDWRHAGITNGPQQTSTGNAGLKAVTVDTP